MSLQSVPPEKYCYISFSHFSSSAYYMVSFGQQVPSETHVWTSCPIFSTQADFRVHGYVVHRSPNVTDSIQIQWRYKTIMIEIQNKYDTNTNQEYILLKVSLRVQLGYSVQLRMLWIGVQLSGGSFFRRGQRFC